MPCLSYSIRYAGRFSAELGAHSVSSYTGRGICPEKLPYQLTNHLSDAQSMEAIGTAALGSIGQTFGCDAALLFLTEKGEAERSYLQYAAGNVIHRELDAGDEVASRVQLLHTGCVETKSGQEWPLYG